MKIMRDVIERIVAHAERDAPIEACGFLAGVEGRITRDYAMTNAERREDHFTFDPNEQLAAYQTIRLEGLEIVGVYHSHPITPAGPSAEDIRLARNPALIYIIVSLLDQVRTVKGFYIKEGTVEEEPLIIAEDPDGLAGKGRELP
jgi:[CysO sulfur-carrier protein]-S-L-cysteine hydrolase